MRSHDGLSPEKKLLIGFHRLYLKYVKFTKKENGEIESELTSLLLWLKRLVLWERIYVRLSSREVNVLCFGRVVNTEMKIQNNFQNATVTVLI